MLSLLPEKRPTVKEIMAKTVVLPIIYAVYLDAGNDQLLFESLNKFRLNNTGSCLD